MSLRKIFFKTSLTTKLYLYYRLYIRQKFFLKKKQYSQWGEDLSINNFFKNKDKGVYLDVGAFHPYMFNNTCLLYQKGWSGINIDINPISIEMFKIARPKDINLCTTISEDEREFEIFYDGPFSTVNTLDKNFYKNYFKKDYNKKNDRLKIRSSSFKKIIKTNKIGNKIDFINIDVEGMDFEILKQIDLKNLQVKLVSIETHKPDGNQSRNFELISNFLKNRDFFHYKRIGPTTLYVLKY